MPSPQFLQIEKFAPWWSVLRSSFYLHKCYLCSLPQHTHLCMCTRTTSLTWNTCACGKLKADEEKYTLQGAASSRTSARPFLRFSARESPPAMFALLSSAWEDLPCPPFLNLPLAEQFSCFLLLLKLLWALPPPDLPSNPTTYVKLFSKARILCPLRGMLLSAVKIMKFPPLLHIYILWILYGFVFFLSLSLFFKPFLAFVTEKAMAPHSSTPAWKIPWTEEPGRLQSMGLLRVRHNWATSLSLFTFMHWRRKWQPTPVFLPGESQGWGSLVGCRLWGHTADTTEVI